MNDTGFVDSGRIGSARSDLRTRPSVRPSTPPGGGNLGRMHRRSRPPETTLKFRGFPVDRFGSVGGRAALRSKFIYELTVFGVSHCRVPPTLTGLLGPYTT